MFTLAVKAFRIYLIYNVLLMTYKAQNVAAECIEKRLRTNPDSFMFISMLTVSVRRLEDAEEGR